MTDEITMAQEAICRRYGSPYAPAHLILKIGINRNFNPQSFPINGLRHPPAGDTTGWYVWSGEWSDDPQFFLPLHAVHLAERCPDILKYLGLAPGWRFLFAPGHEDVWEDRSLLDI